MVVRVEEGVSIVYCEDMGGGGWNVDVVGEEGGKKLREGRVGLGESDSELIGSVVWSVVIS